MLRAQRLSLPDRLVNRILAEADNNADGVISYSCALAPFPLLVPVLDILVPMYGRDQLQGPTSAVPEGPTSAVPQQLALAPWHALRLVMSAACSNALHICTAVSNCMPWKLLTCNSGRSEFMPTMLDIIMGDNAIAAASNTGTDASSGTDAQPAMLYGLPQGEFEAAVRAACEKADAAGNGSLSKQVLRTSIV